MNILAAVFWIGIAVAVITITLYGVHVFSGDLAKLTDHKLVRRARLAITIWILTGSALIAVIIGLRAGLFLSVLGLK